MNYRISGFGFLASREVKAAGIGNLGLQDQREALRWIQKYIGAFGGDRSKVTIWGDSAGAISASLHMLTNNGNTESLFLGAFMQSGAPIPVGDISHGQKYYDAIVEKTGCKGDPDTLNCLRKVEYKKLKDAIDLSPGPFAYQSLALALVPRVDGVFLKDAPQQLIKQGSVANIPFVTGNCDDEGTLFALSSRNVTNEAAFLRYVKNIFFPMASVADVANLSRFCPNNITQGSPFGTGRANALTPEFKRMAAFQGDLVFQAPRRFFLRERAGLQNTWSYLSKRLKHLPFLGSVHTSDVYHVFFGGEIQDYLINFAVNLDSNDGTLLFWPKYDPQNPKLLTF